MWIFDGIITDEDNSTATVTMEQPQTNEDNLLIIGDSQDNTITTDISSSDIPDSAISFFDETTEATQTGNIWTSLFWNEVVSEQESVQLAEEWDIVSFQEEAADNASVNLFWTPEQSDIITQDTTLSVAWNPNEILANAISSLETFLAWHENSIADKMESIEAKQVQINNLKQEIKALNEEAKVVAEEKMKVEKMIELFKSQKV